MVMTEGTYNTMLNLNGVTWQIVSLGKNEIFYYISISNEADSLDYEIPVSEINNKESILPQLYSILLTKPEFTGATLINS